MKLSLQMWERKNWQIDFETDDTITNIWNGNVNKNEAGICSVSSLDYNNVLEPNASVSLGYSAEGNNYNVEHLRISTAGKENSDATTDSDEMLEGPYVYDYDNYTVEYVVKNSWSENCNVCLKITNTSDVAIENWKLVWESEDILSNAYNAEMDCKDNVYTLKNLGYNQDIPAGETIEVGFDVYYGETLDVPKGFVIPDATQTVINDGYTVESIVSDTWDTGYTGELHLTNTGSTVLRDWYLTVQSEDVITNIWIGTLTDLGNGLYGIKNPDHAQNLQPGETIVIGYQAEGTIKNSVVVVMLSVLEENENVDNTEPDENKGENTEGGGNGTGEGTDDEEDTPAPSEPLKDKYIEVQTVFEDVVMDTAYCVEEEIASYHGIVNNLSIVEHVEYEVKDAFENIVQNGEVLYDAENGAWTIEHFGLVIGWNDVIFRIYLTDGTVVEEVHSYLNSVLENMEKTNVGMTDTDGDGINDYFESVYGTDPNLVDSDGDDLTDLEEMLSGTDPAVEDSNEDADGDGLTALDELKYGTSPMYPDSDLDGIDDKKEVTEVGTNPVKEDTDEDGLTDGEELKLGTNPMVADSDGDGIVDSEEKIEQEVCLELTEEAGAVSEVTVSLACSEDIEHQVFIKNTMEEDELSANVVGLVGAPIEINSMTAFDEAEITFRYDRTQLGEAKEENLCIMWYDEANMTYVLLEDSVIDTQNQTVSVVTTHFSTYLLVDSEIWLDAWRSEINYDDMKPEDIQSTYDIIICFNYTVNEEELELEKEFARKIIEQMVEGDRIKYLLCAQNTYRYTFLSWIENKDTALNVLNNMEGLVKAQFNHIIGASGTYDANEYRAICEMVNMVDKNSSNKGIAFIVDSGSDKIHSQMINLWDNGLNAEKALEELGFPVHSISVTDSSNDMLAALLGKNNGRCYNITTWDEIIGKYDYVTNMLDTDGDGLYDTYEINGMKIQNGTVVYTDPLSVDTDGDGITDYAEMGGVPSKVLKDDHAYMINYRISDPNNSESKDKQLKQGYMVVDDFNYLPYDKDSYNAIFFDDTKELDKDGNKIYGLYNIYNSNPEEISRKEIIDILFWTELECILLEGMNGLPEARTFLMKYIKKETDRNFYDCSIILNKSNQTRTMWAEDIYHLMLATEKYLDIGETAIITQTPDNNNHGLDYIIQRENVFDSLNYFLAIHLAKVRTVAKVSYDGTQYIMDMKFYIFDYYDWDKEDYRKYGAVSPSQLYKLCRSGNARFYENWGVYETQIVWEPTEDSRQGALNDEKYLMIHGRRRQD